MEDNPILRCVVAGHVMFHDLRGVVSELLSIWNSVREFVHFSGPRHVKCEADRAIVCEFFDFVYQICVHHLCHLSMNCVEFVL